MTATMVGVATGTAFAQENTELGWSDTAELTLVFTGGNAEASTFGLRNELLRKWDGANLSVEVGALRGESSRITRVATGSSPLSFQVSKESVSALTAENYYGRGRYDRNLSAGTFWYAGAGWERNTFAGFEHRYTSGGGVGNTWVDDETSTFRTAYGVSYTVQDDVAQTQGRDDTFAGVQLSYDYRRQVTATTEFTSVLVADENLEDTADFRGDLINAVAVNISSRLALKVSWQVLYDHLPAQIGLPLRLSSSAVTGDTVFTALDSVDQIVTFAVVARF